MLYCSRSRPWALVYAGRGVCGGVLCCAVLLPLKPPLPLPPSPPLPQTTIEKLKKELQERDAVMADNYDNIQALRRKVQDLEKHKFVLGYKVGAGRGGGRGCL